MQSETEAVREASSVHPSVPKVPPQTARAFTAIEGRRNALTAQRHPMFETLRTNRDDVKRASATLRAPAAQADAVSLQR